MNDQLIMDNYLLILKSTVEVFVHGTLESSNEDVREVLKYGLDETLDSQKETYNLMMKNGWYQVDNVNSNVISETLNKLESSN